MTTIDHRILIPVPASVLWDYLEQLTNIPQWQVDCESVTALNQKQKGAGSRWRQRSTNRQEYVYEITTWYDGLGYEYILVDGTPFKTARGRIRLQEIPEGTIVQWSFEYTLGGGVIGGIRNAISTERRQDKIMVDSLKILWKQTHRLGSLKDYESPSLMRDGIADPDERLRYRTNKPTTTDNLAEPETTSETVEEITEPPLSDEDTKPSRVDETTIRSDSISVDMEVSRFAPPGRNILSEQVQQNDEGTPPTSEEIPATEETGHTITESTDSQSSSEMAKTSNLPVQPAGNDVNPPPITPQPVEDLSPQIKPGESTSEMSIWEVFGIPSPTDTQRMRAIQAGEVARTEYEAEEGQVKTPTSTMKPTSEYQPEENMGERRGYRSTIRQQRVRVRRPKKTHPSR